MKLSRPTNSGLMGLRITEYQTTTRKGAMKNTVTPRGESWTCPTP